MIKPLRTLQALKTHNLISEVSSLAPVADNFQLAITPNMLDAIRANNISDPIYAQFIPQIQELKTTPEELKDPIGDERHSPVKGIVHRYANRVLLKVTSVCAVYCRFCFRREMLGANEQLNTQELSTAIDYIRTHAEIWEVILTGGDPLILSAQKLKTLITRLNEIPHVKSIRIHTRIPIVSPEIITPSLLKIFQLPFAQEKILTIVVHVNHANELTASTKQALADIANAGIPLRSQSVLLKGINDNLEALQNLMQNLLINRVQPYYLHMMDLAKGTEHFRVDKDLAKTLIRALRANASGICVPVMIEEIPGGAGKLPIF